MSAAQGRENASSHRPMEAGHRHAMLVGRTLSDVLSICCIRNVDLALSRKCLQHGCIWSPLADKQDSHDVLVRLPNERNVYDLGRALDAFCSKKISDFLIQNFMDHLYPLTPVVHKPTFFARLNDRAHFHDPAFFSLVISILVTTVCTMPGMMRSCRQLDSSFTHAGRKEMMETGERLILRVRPSNHYDDLSIDKWACAYLHVVANAQLKLVRRALMHHSEANAMARHMGLHTVDAYEGLNHVERQLRKKALWMNFLSERWVMSHSSSTEPRVLIFPSVTWTCWT